MNGASQEHVSKRPDGLTRRSRRMVATIVAVATCGGFATSIAVAGSASAAGTNYVANCDQSPAPGYLACMSLRRTDIKGKSAAALGPDVTPSGYGPTDLRSAYKLTASSISSGAGQRVFIVDAQDDPNAESDLAVYRSQFGLPACTTANGCFSKVNQNGAPSPLPSSDAGWAGEISLDLDMVSAICPNCGITLIEATSASDANIIVASVHSAVTLGAKYVSMSFGGPESSGDLSEDSTFATPGTVFLASTGDDGTGAQYPATSPNVVAVGGTSLTTASNSRGWNESAWVGGGSGCSGFEPKQSWQAGLSSCTKRVEADISADADPNTGVAVYDTFGGSSVGAGGWEVYGGTSASSPMIAATYALAGPSNPAIAPAAQLYSRYPGHTFDITSGSNGSCASDPIICHAGTGWDGPTGLGTPNGVGAFTPTPAITITNPGSQTTFVGNSVSLQVHASTTSGTALTYTATGLPAGLSISSTTGLITGTPTTIGPSSVVLNVSDAVGNATSAAFSWTIASAVTVSVTGSQTYGGSASFSGTTGTSVTVSGEHCSTVNGGTAISPTLAAGTYTIDASSCSGGVLSDPSGAISSYTGGSFAVAKAPLTITASSGTMPFGGTPPVITPGFSGFVNSQTSAALSSQPTCSTTATSTSPVGVYVSTCTGAAAANYTITLVNGTVTVGQASVVITANNKTRTYGAAEPAFTFSVTGLPAGASLTTAPTCGASGDVNVGAYSITCAGASAGSNVTITYVSGTLTVTRAALTVTGPSASVTYGTPAIVLSTAPIPSGLVNGDTLASIGLGSVTCPPNATVSPGGSYRVGTYLTVCSGATQTANYTVGYNTGVLTVAKATLTYTANNLSKFFGQANPALTATAAGFVNGDGPSAVSGTPKLATTAVTASNAGTYPITITAGSLSSTSYTFALVAGTLTVKQVGVVVTTKNISSLTVLLSGGVPFSATVKNAVTGGSAAGVTVTFSAVTNTGAVWGCSGVTNAVGTATCKAKNTAAFLATTSKVFAAITTATPNYAAGGVVGKFT